MFFSYIDKFFSIKGERGQLEVVVTSKEVLSQAKSSGKKKSIQNIASLNFQQWEVKKILIFKIIKKITKILLLIRF